MLKNKVQKSTLIIAGVVAAAVIVFILVLSNQEITPVVMEPKSVQNISKEDTGVAAKPISYAEALAKYADRRIQLDKDCHAYPSNVTYKDNTGIMIDNRSSQTRTVKVGTSFTINPWGFKIVTLPDIYLKSKTLNVDCDGSRNVATILVQE